MALFLAACNGGPVNNFCALNSPRYPTQEQVDLMTRAEKEELVVYNETGERLCGWQTL